MNRLQRCPTLSPYLRYRAPTRRAPAKNNKILDMFYKYSPQLSVLVDEMTTVLFLRAHVWVREHDTFVGCRSFVVYCSTLPDGMRQTTYMT